MSIIPERLPKLPDFSVPEIKDPTVAQTLEEHIVALEEQLADLHKTQHMWLVSNPTVVPDSDPDFRKLRQVIKHVQLDLEISKRQKQAQLHTAPVILFEQQEDTTTPTPVVQPVVVSEQRQKSRFMMRQ